MDSIGTPSENQTHFIDDPEQPIVEPLSVTDKFIGVLTEPAPTFENLAQSGPRTTDWLIPMIALVVIILGSTMLRFSNQTFVDEMRAKGDQQIQKQVESGKMSQEDANKAREQMGAFGGFQKIIAGVGVIIGTPIVLIFFVFAYWLIIKFLARGNITFAFMLSVSGLVWYFGAIDQVVSIILMTITDNPYANFSPAIFLKPSLNDASYKLVMAINPITLFSYYVMGIGLHKVAGISKMKGLIYSYAPWLIVTIVAAFLGFGM